MRMQLATFAGGCFWCLQPPFEKTKGVISIVVGYTGGYVEDPSYEKVCRGDTGHAEAILIKYDPRQVSYEELLKIFWSKIDPTQRNRQFADRGNQYRTAIFYHDHHQRKQAEKAKKVLVDSGLFDAPIVTEIVPAQEFFPAEEGHQHYYKKHADRYERYYHGSGRAVFCPVNGRAVLMAYNLRGR